MSKGVILSLSEDAEKPPHVFRQANMTPFL